MRGGRRRGGIFLIEQAPCKTLRDMGGHVRIGT
jgi:hypothetical protein